MDVIWFYSWFLSDNGVFPCGMNNIPLVYYKVLVLIGFLLVPKLALAAQSENILEDIIGLDPEDISQAAIDFVNLSVNPGISGALFEVDWPNRDVKLLRSNLGFGAEFSIRNHWFDGYWGLALVEGKLEDTLEVHNTQNEPITFFVDRDILSLQGSFGFSFPLNKALKYRPYLSVSAAIFDTHSTYIGRVDGDQTSAAFFAQSETESFTTTIVQEVLYDYRMDSARIELSGIYMLAYTDTFNATNPVLDTFGWSHTGIFKARWSAPTKLMTHGRSWWWNTYYNHVNFIGQEKLSLGFKYYNEVGVGMDYEMNIKPLDLFGLRYVGIKLGGIFGDDVVGGSAGLTFR